MSVLDTSVPTEQHGAVPHEEIGGKRPSNPNAARFRPVRPPQREAPWVVLRRWWPPASCCHASPAWLASGALAGLLLAVVSGLVLIAMVFARPLTAVLAPGLAGETFELTVKLLRIITSGIGFLVLSAWCLAVLNSHRRFFSSYVAPVLLNVTQIAVLVGAGLALFSGGLADGGCRPASRRASSHGRRGAPYSAACCSSPSRCPRCAAWPLASDPACTLTCPAFAAPSAPSCPSSPAGGGTPQRLRQTRPGLSAFRFGQVLYVLPISLFGMSVAAAELPELSHTDDRDRASLRRRLDAGLTRIAFFVVPTTAQLIGQRGGHVTTRLPAGRACGRGSWPSGLGAPRRWG